MSNPSPVFSRPVGVEALPTDGRRVVIEATEAERIALAALDGVAAIAALSADYMLRSGSAGTVKVTGHIRAHVTQICTVSLDPFDSAIDEPVDLTFMPQKGIEAWLSRHKAASKDEPGLDDEDPPDEIIDGCIDLGQIAAEFLSLALDPYPRKPGVAFDAEAYAPEKDESPFAALARLRTPE